MYEQYFGFRERPFALSPDPRFLLLTPRHANAVTMLEYGLASAAAISVLTGDIGCGKTTLTRHLVARLGDDVRAAVINHTHRGSGRLLQWAVAGFGLEPRGRGVTGLYRAVADFVARQRELGFRSLLIVDEAQNLGMARLEELRVLSNLNDGGDVGLQLLLVGQPELRALMGRPQLRQLAQRVAVECNLEPLTLAEAHDYVAHRVAVAGGRDGVFERASIDVAHAHSGGVPRLLNQLCDRALIYVYAEQRAVVDADVMQQAVRDRVDGGIFPDAVPRPAVRRRRTA